MDADGYPHREAARVLLFDDEGRVLLAKGHDEDQPERFWWFTIGGGIEEGRTPAVPRCVRSSRKRGSSWTPTTWLDPSCTELRSLIFWPSPRGKTSGSSSPRHLRPRCSRDGWTDLERSVIDAQAWWDIDEASTQINGEIYPAQILKYARAWARRGGTGHMIRLTDTREP